MQLLHFLAHSNFFVFLAQESPDTFSALSLCFPHREPPCFSPDPSSSSEIRPMRIIFFLDAACSSQAAPPCLLGLAFSVVFSFHSPTHVIFFFEVQTSRVTLDLSICYSYPFSPFLFFSFPLAVILSV